MITYDLREYKTCYYKTNTDKERFEKNIKERFEKDLKYSFTIKIQSDGLFFKNERAVLFGLSKRAIEGIYSEKGNYSLLSISYYSPRFLMDSRRIISLVCLPLILLIDIMEYANYFIDKSRITELLKCDGEVPMEISMAEYHSVL